MNFNKALVSFTDNPKDSLTVDDAMKGVSIMGGTGSGKTTSSGKYLALTYLKEGWGGLVLCAKSDEADLWEEYCEITGRKKDLIRFGKGSTRKVNEGIQEIVFNPIDYEIKRKGEGAGETQNITNIFMSIYRMGNRIASEGDTREERYWDTALKRCLNRVIELLKLAQEDLSYDNMVSVISSSGEVKSSDLTDGEVSVERGEYDFYADENSGYCKKCILKAYQNIWKNRENDLTREYGAYKLVFDYFGKAMPAMGDKTRSVVTESFMGLAEPFLAGLLNRHFSGRTNIFPEETYIENKIIVLDFSIKEFLDMGIIGQSAFKLMFQQAIERRNVEKYPTPVFLWCDEAQYFINSYDQIFLTTARSSRTATVFLSQNISNYFAVMGSGSDAKARVDSLMGNLSTKIFHANSDAETNEYGSRLIGNDIMKLDSEGSQVSYSSFSFSESDGKASQYLPQIQPKEFTILKSGGENNDYIVEAIVFVTGKIWSTKRNYFKIPFQQKFNKT